MSEDQVRSSSPATALIIATAGHVDHGKTALIRHLTGTDTDTLAEEKQRGLSINLGFAYHHFDSNDESIEAKSHTIGFVDVPGHSDFINNMLAGVSAVDAAMLVIAADDGIMPQTREHLAILDLLNIKLGMVVISKIDKVEVAQLDLLTLQIKSLIKNTALQDAKFFPISNISKQGIDSLLSHLQDLHRQKVVGDNVQTSYFRYLIDRAFTVKGIGTVVTGTVLCGAAQIGDSLLHSSSAASVKLKGLQLDEKSLGQARAGQRLAININLPHQQLGRGDYLIDGNLHNPVTRFDASLRLLDASEITLKSNTQYHLFLGASHYVVRIRPLDSPSNKGNWYQISCDSSLSAHYGDLFILRDPACSQTIGGGKVIDIYVPRRGRSSEERLALLAAQQDSHVDTLGNLLKLQANGVDLDKFCRARNYQSSQLPQLLKQLKEANCTELAYVELQQKEKPLPTLLSQAFFKQYSEQLILLLQQHHLSHANQQGVSEPSLNKAMQFGGSHYLLHSLIEKLITLGLIVRTGTLLHLPQHKAKLSQEEQDFINKIQPILLKGGFIAPRTRELEELTGIKLAQLDQILKLSKRSGSLIQVAKNRYYLPETIMELAEFTEKLASENADGDFSVIQFRDASGIGRNLCIEILEYFDGVGFTRRDGNSRFVRTHKDNIFT